MTKIADFIDRAWPHAIFWVATFGAISSAIFMVVDLLNGATVRGVWDGEDRAIFLWAFVCAGLARTIIDQRAELRFAYDMADRLRKAANRSAYLTPKGPRP